MCDPARALVFLLVFADRQSRAAFVKGGGWVRFERIFNCAPLGRRFYGIVGPNWLANYVGATQDVIPDSLTKNMGATAVSVVAGPQFGVASLAVPKGSQIGK